MKVIFLDVDGVLNSEECLDVPEQSCEYLYDASTIVPLLKRCVDNLQEICKATSAKVGKIFYRYAKGIRFSAKKTFALKYC